MPKKADIVSHWYHLIEVLQESPKNFYASLEASIAKREPPEVSISRVDYLEGGMLSSRREYLRVKRRNYVFDICAAPFGRGFFISWWLAEDRPSWVTALIGLAFLVLMVSFLLIKKIGLMYGLMLGAVLLPLLLVVICMLIRSGTIPIDRSMDDTPIIGPIYARFFRSNTYYQIDTALMFQESIRLAVLEAIDLMTKAGGLRALSESERKPILSDLFKR